MVLLAMCITALVGVFLPVPITFDVIVTAVLMGALVIHGLNPGPMLFESAPDFYRIGAGLQIDQK